MSAREAAARDDAARPVTVDVPFRGGRVDLEIAWCGPSVPDRPTLVFLHEGLGSVSTWRDWPAEVANACGMRGLMYSRYGYGASTPRPHDERWPTTFMHEQAFDVLPALFERVGLDTARDPPWLVGHSDGGSIALLYAARYPDRVAGLVAIAPHVFVEALTIASIRDTKVAYETTDLRTKLARHHRDVDSAFYGWNDVWLDPAFRDWNIVASLSAIRTPVLAVQGRDDRYGTLAQVEVLVRHAGNAELQVLDGCGHSPHREQPDVLRDAVRRFVERHRGDPR